MRLGKISGISCKINPFFLAIILLFGLSGWFVLVCAVFFFVLLHEFAHLIVAKGCGYKIDEIELLPFGGALKIEGFWGLAPQKVFVTALAGPVCSLGLAAFCAAMSEPQGATWRVCAEINAALACFNLLPAFPLDGGHMSRALLLRFVSYQKATRWLAYLSRVLSVGLLGKVIYDAYALQALNLSLLIVAVFVFHSARREVQHSRFHAARVMAYKKADLCQKGCMPVDHYAVLQATELRAVTHLFTAERYAVLIVLDDMHQRQGTVTELEVWDGLGKRGASARFADLLA